MSSPNARSLALLEREGYLAAIVEKWSPFPKPWGKRHDLWGFVDLIGIKDGRTVLVQSTTGDHVHDRLLKILGHKNYPAAKASRAEIFIHGWAKRGARGKRKIWDCRIVKIDELRPEALEDLKGDSNV